MTTEVHFMDGGGRPYVGIEPTNAPGYLCYIDTADLDQVRDQYGAKSIFLASNGAGKTYVTISDHRRRNSRVMTLARAVMQPERTAYVVYRDGDRLNVRRSNLALKRLTLRDPQGPKDNSR